MESKKRLLIVDDEETLTFTLYQTFISSPIDCEVVTASDGDEALSKFEQNPFDLVISDIAMPGKNGLELLSLVKVRKPDTSVILITAYGSDEREQQAYNLGADKYVEKPFDINELRETVIKMLE